MRAPFGTRKRFARPPCPCGTRSGRATGRRIPPRYAGRLSMEGNPAILEELKGARMHPPWPTGPCSAKHCSRETTSREGEIRGGHRRALVKDQGMSHGITGAWSLDDDEVGIAEAVVTYTRKDDSLFIIKACTVL